MIDFETHASNAKTKGADLSIYPSRCGTLSPVAPTATTGYWNDGEMFYQVATETDGNLIVEGIDGQALYYPNVVAGVPVVTRGRRILSSADIDGIAVTTSVTGNVWVYGGF